MSGTVTWTHRVEEVEADPVSIPARPRKPTIVLPQPQQTPDHASRRGLFHSAVVAGMALVLIVVWATIVLVVLR